MTSALAPAADWLLNVAVEYRAGLIVTVLLAPIAAAHLCDRAVDWQEKRRIRRAIHDAIHRLEHLANHPGARRLLDDIRKENGQ